MKPLQSTLFFLLTVNALQAQADAPSILAYTEEALPHIGVLKSTSKWIYLDVDNDYIYKLVNLIEEADFEIPPYFYTPDGVGAHITVVYPEEMRALSLQGISEEGHSIPFTLCDCKLVHPPMWKEMEAVYMLVVEAPELDAFRKKYGLPKGKYPFHITIGVKPRHAF